VTDDDRAEVEGAVRGRVRADVPMAPMCSYRVGGDAALVVEPVDEEDLAHLLVLCRQRSLQVLVVGGGSNLLVADGGFPGVVVRLRTPPFQVLEDDGEWLRLGAGVGVSRLMGRAGRHGWAHLAFLEGIPGTVGGCVAMNAGTRQGEIKDILVRAEVVTAEGARRTLSLRDCGFGYRRSSLPEGAVVTAAVLDPGQGEPQEVKAALKRHQDHRKATQPSGTSGGSVFANPPGDHAGRLIEAAGLKGLRRGGARISERHANWILTEPGATAADVRGLMIEARRRVLDDFGVALRAENRLAGFDG